MKLILFLLGFLAFVRNVSSVPELEDEDGSLTNEEESLSRSKRWTWRRCGSGYQCPEGYYCRGYWSGYWCYPKRTCSHHSHCSSGYYCDHRESVCKRGERRCSSHYHCTRGRICVNGKCQAKQCSYVGQCPGDKVCVQPGLCQDYKQRCYNHYYCHSGLICISGWCKKPQCSYNKPCQQGHQCHGGICKPIPGYCPSHASCPQDQCCLRNRCSPKIKPGNWCLLRSNGSSCSCVPGHFCKRWNGNYHWGVCTKEPTQPPTTAAPPTTEEPGSGSGDFF